MDLFSKLEKVDFQLMFFQIPQSIISSMPLVERGLQIAFAGVELCAVKTRQDVAELLLVHTSLVLFLSLNEYSLHSQDQKV